MPIYRVSVDISKEIWEQYVVRVVAEDYDEAVDLAMNLADENVSDDWQLGEVREVTLLSEDSLYLPKDELGES